MADVHHNLTKVKEAIKEGIGKVRTLKNEREDVNADLQEVRTGLQALGIPKKAFDMAMQYLDMDADKREGFDIAYALVREVGGLPLQDDLFTAAARKGDEPVPGASPKEPDAAGIEKVIASQEAEKVKGKIIHQPTGEHKGTIN